MKRKYSTIFTITVAAVLISSIAYAAKKKLQTKSSSQTLNLSEVDLVAGLMDTKGELKQKLPKPGDTKMRGDEELKDLTMV
jgi:hypothetical protein